MLKASVVFTTYNSPGWLMKVLWGYEFQNERNFEVLIADDGSGFSTQTLVEEVKKTFSFPIIHVWHEDKGFRKCEILNKAVQQASADYLIFSDGDCIPRSDFITAHLAARRHGQFLSGGAVRLPMNLSKKIDYEHICTQQAFEKSWLVRHGLRPVFFQSLKLTQNPKFAALMNQLTPTSASWNGNNASAWKKDIFAVNGFDERMKYGAEDREFGERLRNSGVKGRQVRYSAVCLHLDHERSYVNEADLKYNAAIWKETKAQKKTWTDYGIVKTGQ